MNNGLPHLTPAALQNNLNQLIDGIKDEKDENTQLSESSQ